ncbi:hypothetical protein B0T14DRAFT_87836 [Immersiella caudata]|uniref:Heterokaryon incompatibility domain-containing protein n=1 Tax=Immersiella caudata TaxID=314043 RepID=A0AA39X207_9PEZI|nr:hypothetical protein B0T14DRAFT_87836 [Immersiella caudata]
MDQTNPNEKTHQVGRMKGIYEKADRVLIWLGRATQHVDLLFEMMGMLEKRVSRRKDDRKDEVDAWVGWLRAAWCSRCLRSCRGIFESRVGRERKSPSGHC